MTRTRAFLAAITLLGVGVTVAVVMSQTAWHARPRSAGKLGSSTRPRNAGATPAVASPERSAARAFGLRLSAGSQQGEGIDGWVRNNGELEITRDGGLHWSRVPLP